MNVSASNEPFRQVRRLKRTETQAGEQEQGALKMSQARTTRSRALSGAAARLAALIAMVQASPIWAWPEIRAPRSAPSDWLPAGYDETDLRVLEWIVSHRRGRSDGRARPAISPH